MPLERRLTVPEGYDAAANPRVASFAAQLDDQLSRLKKDVAGLEVRHLEWQPHNGINTIGMLLAHLAVVDVLVDAAGSLETPEAECDAIMRDTIGILMDDDGLPLAPEAAHPASLAGKSLEDYLAMIDRARAATHGAAATVDRCGSRHYVPAARPGDFPRMDGVSRAGALLRPLWPDPAPQAPSPRRGTASEELSAVARV
ncbi:MAG: hypothetical protein R3E12_04015 [Candidatus Eisenbacteria bacterium]